LTELEMRKGEDRKNLWFNKYSRDEEGKIKVF